MKHIVTQSPIRPLEWDTESSSAVVYHNYNIKEVTVEEAQVYEFDMDVLTREEYAEHLAEKNRADVDYIAIMVDIPLE